MTSEAVRQEIILSLGCCVPACWREPERHHVRTAANSGMGMKPSDKWIVPMCHMHHMEGHKIGWQRFEKRYRISLVEIAKELAQIDRDMP